MFLIMNEIFKNRQTLKFYNDILYRGGSNFRDKNLKDDRIGDNNGTFSYNFYPEGLRFEMQSLEILKKHVFIHISQTVLYNNSKLGK